MLLENYNRMIGGVLHGLKFFKMIRRLNFCLILILFLNCLGAQVTLSALVPNGVNQKQQLWNLSVVNTGGTFEGQVKLEVRELDTRQVVLSGVTPLFIIKKGANIINSQLVQPVSYNYSAGFMADQSSNGLLSVGRFQVCYQLLASYHANVSLVAEDCVQLQVEALSPPLLNMPSDRDTIETVNPSFSWIPPGPISMFQSLNYDFVLSELLSNQSPTDAVRINLPVLQLTGIRQSNLFYPLSAQKLTTGKTYVWQITAKDQFRYAGRSETWIFTYGRDSIKNIKTGDAYAQLGSKAVAPSTFRNGALKIAYEHQLKDNSVLAEIFSVSSPKKSIVKFKVPVVYGQNYIDYEIKEGLLTENELYEVRFINKNGEVNYLRFTTVLKK